MIVVSGPQVTRASTATEFLSALSAFPAVPSLGCVCWTKQDLIADGVSPVRQGPILAGTPWAEWPAFYTRLDQPDTLDAPIDWLFEQIEP